MLDAYLARIGLDQRPDPTPAGLQILQRAHRLAIGFENFDVMLGRPIPLGLPAVWAKLGGRRGGYCFEHNALFGAILDELGLPNRPLLARVWLGLQRPAEPAIIPPLTHTLRLVTIGAETWLADAGFGGSYVPPLPLVDGSTAETPDGAVHRLMRCGEATQAHGAWLLERLGPASATDGRATAIGVWAPQYSFNLSEVAPVDLELSNWWTSTRPGTRFTSGCLASAVLPDGFAALSGCELSLHTGGAASKRHLATAGEWREALGDIFAIDLKLDEIARLGLF
ncbi:arylamine N-acetyltransferase [Novosphingobium piscinae]|uniref:Arylamine N-acetyltransferase n=1 Tax=Novosphingobium piscinae TaxID=1507448 RepID=A0A7X1FXK6_9SPHN|nr:arylamine N-acetyltransferase [Novosphingobium piscinae]MBC2668873.1 arylamine N-acetyltransferase [Novosphingobium piscinae]